MYAHQILRLKILQAHGLAPQTVPNNNIGCIKIGDVFKNSRNDIRVVNKISKTGLIIHTKNESGVVERFRFYEATGKYFVENKPNTDLGEPLK